MRELNQMIEVRKKLKEIDTILYEIVRDYRVSGHPADNRLMIEMLRALDVTQYGIGNFLKAISTEAKKSHVTGV